MAHPLPEFRKENIAELLLFTFCGLSIQPNYGTDFYPDFYDLAIRHTFAVLRTPTGLPYSNDAVIVASAGEKIAASFMERYGPDLWENYREDGPVESVRKGQVAQFFMYLLMDKARPPKDELVQRIREGYRVVQPPPQDMMYEGDTEDEETPKELMYVVNTAPDEDDEVYEEDEDPEGIVIGLLDKAVEHTKLERVASHSEEVVPAGDSDGKNTAPHVTQDSSETRTHEADDAVPAEPSADLNEETETTLVANPDLNAKLLTPEERKLSAISELWLDDDHRPKPKVQCVVPVGQDEDGDDVW
jgi:hypothetical protein